MTKRVGLLGGSFNPAHKGHLHLSQTALDRLGLDEVWWMVSPQNPLKSTLGMAPFAERVAKSRLAAAAEPRIIVSEIERDMGTRYTIDTLQQLRVRFADTRFVFLLGADNFIQLPQWRGWSAIFRTVPIAIFPRPSYSYRALTGRAAKRFARFRVPDVRAHRLAERRAPAWVFVGMAPDATSATRIRQRQELLLG
jgi:nicotinate-nucleotide adenylyltransferase